MQIGISIEIGLHDIFLTYCSTVEEGFKMTVATYNEVGCLTPLKQFFLLNPQNSYLKIVPYFSSLNFSS